MEVDEKTLMSPSGISMLLNETPGLRVQAAAPGLGTGSVRILGLPGQYTVMLADGLPLYGASARALGPLDISPVDLQRVEIIKGAASALQGGQALGGVINLVSKPPTGGKEFLLNRRTMAVTDGATWLSHRCGNGVGVSLLGDPRCVRNSRELLLTAYGSSIADAVLLAEMPGAAGQTELQNALTRTRVGGVEALAVWRFAGGKFIANDGYARGSRPDAVTGWREALPLLPRHRVGWCSTCSEAKLNRVRATWRAVFALNSHLAETHPMSQSTGRNDPCPCGSGRKYKKCHEASDVAASPSPHLRLVSNASAPARNGRSSPPPAGALAAGWEAAIAPMPGSFADDPAARPVMVMVVAGGFVLSCQLENRPSEEPEALAALLARDIVAAIEQTGVTPPRVCIRQALLVEPLLRALGPTRIAVQLQPDLPGLDDALRSVLGHVFTGITPSASLRSQPETWAGWGMPTDEVARIFRAAAAFHRSAPWTTSTLERPILISRDGGPEWAAVVLGAAGNQTGLAFYQDPADLQRVHSSDEGSHNALCTTQGAVVALLFNERLELPKPMREEIKRARWDVAGPEAYPTLLVLNTPGGGIRHTDFALLRDALVSVPRFVTTFAPVFSEGRVGEPDADAQYDDAIAWTDAETGLTCRLDAIEYPDLMSSLATLEPAGATGAGATPLTMLNEVRAPRAVADTLARFGAALRHPVGGKPLSDATAAKHIENARLLVELCVFGGARPIGAVNEYDLRTLLYDWYPRTVRDTERGARALIVSLRKFFMFLREHEGVECAWANALLADTDAFLERWRTFPGGFWWDERVDEWRAFNTMELMARVLIPDTDPAGGIEWSDTMGKIEHALYLELHGRWLAWRDEAIRGGVVEPSAVLALLQERQRRWTTTPNARGKKLTPMVAIERERASIEQRLGDVPRDRS